jgi:FtsH-binding integral membrane protein
MYTVGYFCVLDDSYLVYYALWMITSVTLGYSIYGWAAPNGMSTMVAMMIVLLACLAVCLLFLVFTPISFIGLTLVLLALLIFGFDLHYDIRKVIRGGVRDYNKDDPFAGAVTIWAEGLLVFVRFSELLTRACCLTRD